MINYIILDIGIVLSKKSYKDWKDIQSEYFEFYKTNLRFEDKEALLSYFSDDFKEEDNWPFSANEVSDFIEGRNEILCNFDISIKIRNQVEYGQCIMEKIDAYIHSAYKKHVSSILSCDFGNEASMIHKQSIDGQWVMYSVNKGYNSLRIFEIEKQKVLCKQGYNISLKEDKLLINKSKYF